MFKEFTIGVNGKMKMDHALVRPLLKKKDLELIYKNYRPVSNLKFISKLVEKAVLSQFY